MRTVVTMPIDSVMAKPRIGPDGPGIPDDERAHVVERGARLDERVSGQGIGLSVVRELVQLNGGTIVIEESPLGGARLEVRLPPV